MGEGVDDPDLVRYGVAGKVVEAGPAHGFGVERGRLGAGEADGDLTLLRMFALYVPLAYLGAHLWGLPGIFAGACAANALVGLGAFFWEERFFRAAREASPGRASC